MYIYYITCCLYTIYIHVHVHIYMYICIPRQLDPPHPILETAVKKKQYTCTFCILTRIPHAISHIDNNTCIIVVQFNTCIRHLCVDT